MEIRSNSVSVNNSNSAKEFETYRGLIFGLAYRLLGSAMEAEDVVQETYLRYHSVPPTTIASPRAFLTTIATRLCLNQLQSARVKRETYIGPWLPEPILTETESDPYLVLTGDGKSSLQHESISMAFLVLLEQLTPLERAVFLLREVFEYEYREIAEIIDKQESACRQLFSRAKKHIGENRPRFKPDQEAHHRLLEQFLRAVRLGDMDGLLRLLEDEVTFWADGGGKARGAATRPLHGREAVARFVIASTRLPVENYFVEIKEVNGEQGVILRTEQRVIAVLLLEEEGGLIKTIRAIGNPDKLAGM
ncbi:MAG TPA: RNA polymerase sigma-70 factor [Chloroflexia bacterium]|nr:RNA polymerase sigma-70 factor [Chloroflexia bacterium]